MSSYRLKRRAFLSALGGAVGLEIMLRNLEASAQGPASPPRFLMLHWPLGTIPYHFRPVGTRTDFQMSRVLQPFEDAGLRQQMTVLYGLTHAGLASNGGGGQEAGTVFATTGAPCPGTRANGGEGDDGVAGGPSFDQIFLRHVPELAQSGVGFANAICDARVDSQEISTQCLSYGYDTRSIESANPGGLITEHVPLMPALSPYDLYVRLFGAFAPDATLSRELRLRKSVLDSALRELTRLRELAPSSQRERIDAHTEIIRGVELGLSDACTPPNAPSKEVVGKSGSQFAYNDPRSDEDDGPALEQLGRLHMSVIRAAFQCDLIRVATFQWAPGTNRVAFHGLYPGEPDTNYMHHPLSHRLSGTRAYLEPPQDPTQAAIVEFLSNCQTWFNRQTANILVDLKQSLDVFGNPLLDTTIVPYVTEIAHFDDARSPLPAMIFGGSALGVQGGQYLNFESERRHHNDLWMTIAQAYLGTDDPMTVLAEEQFFKNGVAPIDGLVVPP